MRRLSCWLALAAALTLVAGCGHKRPPVISTGAGAPATAPPPPPSAPQPLEGGPDVAPVQNEAALGADLDALDATSEHEGPLADIQFEFDQATLTDEARSMLEKHALWLQSHRDARVTIEGHCDERGTVEYNLALGDRRAAAARDYLVSLGVAGDRLRVVSLGKERPLDPGHDEAAWARNRRAHFVVGR